MTRKIRLAVWLTALALFAGCIRHADKSLNASSNPDVNDTRFKYVISKVPRETSPNVSQSDRDELRDSNTDFTFSLYHELKNSPGNIIFSPHSITTAMALLYAGARGDSEKEIATAFHYTLPQDRLHAAFNALDLDLKSRGKPDPKTQGRRVMPGQEPWFTLNVANALWGPPEDAWERSYLDLIAKYYGTGLRTLDIGADPEAARQIINEWVSENTNDKIPELIHEDELITDSTVLVITNAVYFKARWELPFEESNTKPGDFHLLDGTVVFAQMMEFTDSSYSFRWAEGEGWTAIELPYDLDGMDPFRGQKDNISMHVIVPDSGRFDEFETSLDGQKLESIISSYNEGPVHLFFPKFEYRFHKPLREPLSNLGMPSVFGHIDLSGMLPGSGLFVRDVIHEAYIQVDEKGTEAAAATAIGVDMKGDEPLDLTVDRPFIYVIRDEGTGAILFIGRVLNPLEA